MKIALLGGALAVVLAPAAIAQNYEMTTPIAPGVATPIDLDRLIAPLDLIDDSPTAETLERIYDKLERSLQTYLRAIPIVTQGSQ
jgi:hypothetical protein